MLQLLAFARSPLGRIALTVLAVLTLSASLYAKGRHDGKASEIRAEAQRLERARKAVIKRESAASKITEQVGEKLSQERVVIQYRTKTLIERIPVEQDPSRGSLPGWFISLHDSAATGLPEASRGSVSPDTTPSGVTDAEALKVIVPNYGVCQLAIARNQAWESFYGQLRETYNAR